MYAPRLDTPDGFGGLKNQGKQRVINVFPEDLGSARLISKGFDMIKRFPDFLRLAVRHQEETEGDPEGLGKSGRGVFVAGIQLVITAIPGVVTYRLPPAEGQVYAKRRDGENNKRNGN